MVKYATMWDRWLKQAAFWGSLLLALCILDSSFGSRERSAPFEGSVALTLHSLELQVRAAAPDGTPKKEATAWTAQIFSEEKVPSTDGRGERSYRLVTQVTGTTPAFPKRELAEGCYWIVVRAQGFARTAERVELRADSSVSLLLAPAQSLLVRVLAEIDDTLTPLGGATVLVGDHGRLPLGDQTDKKGETRFDDLSSGPQKVRIFAPGYAPYEGMAERELLVRLRPVNSLRIHVEDGGKAQAGAHVYIAGAQLWPARMVSTGETGRVDITGLKPGRYSLYAEKDERVSRVHPDVDILAQKGLVELTLELNQGAFVPLLVISRENEKPVPLARVTWSSSGLGQFSLHKVTGENGRVRLGPLSELGGVLSVRAPGYVARVVPVEPLSEREEGSDAQIIRLERSATIEGRVVDADGFPVPGASVEIAGTDMFGMPISVTHQSDAIADAHFDWAEEMGNVLIPAGELGVMLGPVPPIPLGDVAPRSGRSLTTNEKGYFVAEDIPPGEVVVLARHPAHMDGKSAAIKLGPGARGKTTIVLGKGSPLRGRVVDHRGFPLAHARIHVSARDFDRRVTAESDGTFLLSAAPKTVTLRVSHFEQPLRVVFSQEVSETERAGEIAIELPEPKGPATVTVRDPEGEAIELAQVTIVSLEPGIPFKSTRFSGADGSTEFFEAEGLKARVIVSAPGFVEATYERSLKKENVFSLGPSLRAVGRVLAVRGRLPAASAQVIFRSGSVIRTTVTDDIGGYRLTGLPPGTGLLTASHPEYGKGRATIHVKAVPSGEETELPDLHLSPTLEVNGQVVDERGRALPSALLAAVRLSPYLPAGGTVAVLGHSNEKGEFTISVEREKHLYLYAALPGRAYGFSDAISFDDKDRVSEVRVIIDRPDKIPPNELGTVLIALEEGPEGLSIYAVAEGSQAASSGLLEDDLLLDIDGESPRNAEDARALLSGMPGGDVRLGIQRRGRRIELLVSRESFLR